jgi:Fur family iron response transcriptional regulator
MTMPKREPGQTQHAVLAQRLRRAGLRPTRQRVALGILLFQTGNRHVTPEILHQEATAVGALVSLATVYNALHQFTEAGLLRRGAVNADHSYFDTNTEPHQHFYIESERLLIDIPGHDINIAGIPALPVGTTIDCFDLVVRLRRGPKVGSCR